MRFVGGVLGVGAVAALCRRGRDALLVLLAAWLTRDTGERDIYEISTRETVTGLQAQAPVRYRGVDVGKVAALGFDPKVQGNVLMRLEIEREAPVTEDTFATLGFQGVTGLSFVQLDDSGKTSPRLVPNDEVPPRIPLKPGLLSKISAKGEVILDQVEQITARMNKILADPNQQRLATALDNVGQAAASPAPTRSAPPRGSRTPTRRGPRCAAPPTRPGRRSPRSARPPNA